MRPDDDALRAVVAERAVGMGQEVEPDDITITWMPEDPAPGVGAFVGRYRWADSRAAITGIVAEGEPPNTLPRDAVAELFRRWTQAGPIDPDVAADAIAFLLGGVGPAFAVHRDNIDDLVSQEAWKTHVEPPAVVDVDGAPGVCFWWLMRIELQQMTVFAVPGGVDVRTRFIRDFLAPPAG